MKILRKIVGIRQSKLLNNTMLETDKIIIDKTALLHNYAKIRALAPKSQIAAVIKANAYGHGALNVAKILPDADIFAVACVSEAIALRQAKIKNEILILQGFVNSDELKTIAKLKCQTIIHNEIQLNIFTNTKLTNKIITWFKIDTGMRRLGFAYNNFALSYARLAACKNNKVDPILISHFASADSCKTTTLQQLQNFIEHTKHFNNKKSFANSAAIINHPETHFDYVRPGIMLYGVSPINNTAAKTYDLKPVMTFTGKIIAIKNCQIGDLVGYSGTWRCEKAMPIAIINTGYSSGYPIAANSKTPVLINDKLCYICGRVSMDMLTVNIENCPSAKINDTAILWGTDLPVETIANSINTISYDLLCRTTPKPSAYNKP